jgi:hypothetical protein
VGMACKEQKNKPLELQTPSNAPGATSNLSSLGMEVNLPLLDAETLLKMLIGGVVSVPLETLKTSKNGL